MHTTISRVFAAVLAGGLAIATFSLYTYQAAAFMGGGDEDRTEIRTENKADVHNDVSVEAKTGGNEAEGGNGGRGGDGGDTDEGDGGDGGNGGAGGEGGTISSGDAAAFGDIFNDVNSTRITVEGCGCDDDEPLLFSRFMSFGSDKDRLDIRTKNDANVHNSLSVEAKTGYNEVDGGDGGDGDDGGDAGDRRSRYSWMNWFSWWNQNTGGDGGDGGAGGAGGTVDSGEAYAEGIVTNLVNDTIVRTNRGAVEESD